MKNKNLFTLTIIAVATLLVAVVGATYAFFGVTGSTTSTSTSITGTMPSQGTVTLTNPTPTQSLNLTAAQMNAASSSEGDKTYYSLNASTGDALESASSYQIALATVNDGETTTKYSCSFTMEVTVGGTIFTEALASLGDGVANIVFGGNSTISGNPTTVDLKTIYAETNHKKSYTVTMNNLTGSNTTQNVQAYLTFTNLKLTDQGGLADKGITVNVNSSGFKCDVIS